MANPVSGLMLLMVGRNFCSSLKHLFEDPDIIKVWYNCSFDSHIIENYGIEVSGFHADTMHMARLWNSSRRTEGGYSLEALTGDRGFISDAERELWICYSALDAMNTLGHFESLKRKSQRMSWRFDGKPCPQESVLDLDNEYWRPFGEILVKMVAEGMLVDRACLAEIEKVAKPEQEVAVDRFRKWASKYCEDAKYMNGASDAQPRQLLFGGTSLDKKCNFHCLSSLLDVYLTVLHVV